MKTDVRHLLEKCATVIDASAVRGGMAAELMQLRANLEELGQRRDLPALNEFLTLYCLKP